MKFAALIVGLAVFVIAGCERPMARVQSPEPAPAASPAPKPSITFGPTPDTNKIYWEQRAKEVKIGMRRAEVERLLPSYSRPTVPGEDFRRFSTLTGGTGGGQGVRYHVSEDVEVIVSYDYTGVPRGDATGTAIDCSSPENRVTAPVQIEREIK